MFRSRLTNVARGARSFSAGASKTVAQAMMDIPGYNAHHWIDTNGGMFAPIGEGLNGKSFALIGGGQANLFLGYHLAKAGGDFCVTSQVCLTVSFNHSGAMV